MYLNFFKLNKEPFQITPDPSFLYLSSAHKEALASIIYGVEKRKGFILILGAVGVGKTTVLKTYLERHGGHSFKIIYIFNPQISYHNLIKQVLRDLDISAVSENTYELLDQLHQALIAEYKLGRIVLLFIDEAQNMPVDTLENVRMLSNLETTSEKLLQIVFSAQPEFEKTLDLQELKQLKQRIAVKAVITPLTKEEGIEYIQHRLSVASGATPSIFTPKGLKCIVRAAKGIPRVINIICDNSLITAYGYGKRTIGTEVINEIKRDFGFKTPPLLAWFKFGCVLLVISAVMFLGILHVKNIPAQPVSAILPSPAVSLNVVSKNKVVSGPQDVTRLVERGDTLARLVKKVYGHIDPKLLQLVKKANPEIANEDLIVEGERIVFPAGAAND
jgi:general secretion pathway protein A